MADFSLKCILLGTTSITGTLSPLLTVEQVKKWVFKNSPSLFSLGNDQFNLGLTQKDLLNDESALFIESHPQITSKYTKREDICISLFPNETLFNYIDLSSADSPLSKAVIAAPAPVQTVLKEGFLTKRGHSIQSWKNRWFVLQNNFLFYFRTKYDPSPLGAIPLQDCVYCGLYPGGRKNCFSVHTRARTFLLIANSLRESNEWITVINQCLTKMGIVPIDPGKGVCNVAFFSVSEATKSGYLYKTGKDNKGWKKRYFIMKENFLYYFKSNKATVPCGTIALQGAKVIQGKQDQDSKKGFRFQIQTHHRTFKLAADDQPTMQEWVQAIEQHLEGNEYLQQSLSRSITFVVPEKFWENKPRTTFRSTTNHDVVVQKLIADHKSTIELNESYFGPLDHITDEEVCYQLATTYLALKSPLSVPPPPTSPKPSLEVEILFNNSNLPERFPVFVNFPAMVPPDAPNAWKQFFCNGSESVKDIIQQYFQSKPRPQLGKAGSSADIQPKQSISNPTMIPNRDSPSPSSNLARAESLPNSVAQKSLAASPKTENITKSAPSPNFKPVTRARGDSQPMVTSPPPVPPRSGPNTPFNTRKVPKLSNRDLAGTSPPNQDGTLSPRDHPRIENVSVGSPKSPRRGPPPPRLNRGNTTNSINPPPPPGRSESSGKLPSSGPPPSGPPPNGPPSSGPPLSGPPSSGPPSSGPPPQANSNSPGPSLQRSDSSVKPPPRRGQVKSAENFTFKLPGKNQYVLDPSVSVNQIAYIRDCIQQNKKIQFTIVPREAVRKIEQAPSAPIGGSLSNSDSSTPVLGSQERDCISHQYVQIPFMVKVVAVENAEIFDPLLKSMRDDGGVALFVECYVAYGTQTIGSIMRTQKRQNSLFADCLSSTVQISSLPREATLHCTLFAIGPDEDFPLAKSTIQIFDFEGKFRLGSNRLPMIIKHKIASNIGNTSVVPILTIEFVKAPVPVVHLDLPNVTIAELSSPSRDEIADLARLAEKDQLHFLTDPERKLIRAHKTYILQNSPQLLAKFLQIIDWESPEDVQEAQSYIAMWPTIPPKVALTLIDANVPNYAVRKFAVKCLENLTDSEFRMFLLQLVQALKYERYHYSPLMMFILKRATQDITRTGHFLFWHLASDLEINRSNKRFRSILEVLLVLGGKLVNNFYRQVDLIKHLKSTAEMLKKVKPNRRDQVLREELGKFQFSGSTIQLPIDPQVGVNEFILEKCKTLDSFTVPLWLVFRNSNRPEESKYVIFKAGDDLRQDVLTLQMFHIMDELWKSNGLDLHLTPYQVVSTGNESGMIQVVLNAETTANIQKMAGGATAAFSSKPLTNWLMEHNKTETLQKTAINNFMLSLAGYCVATYVLGIGDRHNDNIMVTKDGHLFHIDFAHFLGNVISFHGFKRERAPFVLTPDFVNVIGGKDSPGWNQFVSYCLEAFDVVRRYSYIIISLFMLMLSTGMPQLSSPEDLEYFRESFCIGKNNEEAKQIFAGLILESLNTKATQLNFAIHILAHPD